MVELKTSKGIWKYKNWQWYSAWLLVYVIGIAVGALIF